MAASASSGVKTMAVFGVLMPYLVIKSKAKALDVSIFPAVPAGPITGMPSCSSLSIKPLSA